MKQSPRYLKQWFFHLLARISYFINEWILTTNHRKIAILYFLFVLLSGFTGLILATIIRLELAYPGQFFLTNNAERYLTTISLHGIVMVFFMIIPVIFGAFGNFLLPTQLGIRDVAFPRLNSFMFWVTPAGFVMLLHILLFDKSYQLTYWVNYSELKAQLRRRYQAPVQEVTRYHTGAEASALAWRLASMGATPAQTRAAILKEAAPLLDTTGASTVLSHSYTPASLLAAAKSGVSAILTHVSQGASHLRSEDLAALLPLTTPHHTLMELTHAAVKALRGNVFAAEAQALNTLTELSLALFPICPSTFDFLYAKASEVIDWSQLY